MFDFKKPTECNTSLFFRFGCFQYPENPQLDSNSVQGSTWKHVQLDSNSVQRSTWKHVQSDVCERSGSSWKQYKVLNIILKGQGCICMSTTCKSLIIYSLTKSSRTFDRNYVLGLMYLMRRTNVLIWELVMSTTMKASIHLGPSYNDILVAYRNTDCKALKTLFDITQRLILE